MTPPAPNSHGERLEREARIVGDDHRKLLIELQSARRLPKDRLRRSFGKGVFNFERKRLEGADGASLQWLLRPNPDAPVGPGNQQTSLGRVIYVPAAVPAES